MSAAPSPTGFSTGLCSCFSDCGVCCVTYFCPCYQVAKNKAMADKRDCTCCDCICNAGFLEWFTRQQIRARFNLPMSPCADCLAVLYCIQCVICQDARELKIRNN